MNEKFPRTLLYFMLFFFLCGGLLVLLGIRTDSNMGVRHAPSLASGPPAPPTAALAQAPAVPSTDWLTIAIRLGILFLAILIYFWPALNARERRHRERRAIFALNLLLGWTVLGWIGAFVWSCTSQVEPARMPVQS